MVSIKDALTLGAIGVAIALFFGAGGFKGVGTKIGGFFGEGFATFGQSLQSAFSFGLLGGSPNPNTGGSSGGSGGGGGGGSSGGALGIPPATGTGAFDPFGNLLGNLTGLQNLLNNLNNFFTGQAGAFQVGGQGGPTFATALFPVQTSTGTQFGGFINAQVQADALDALLAENKRKFPGFF